MCAASRLDVVVVVFSRLLLFVSIRFCSSFIRLHKLARSYIAECILLLIHTYRNMYICMYVCIFGLLSATFGQSTTFVLHLKPRTSRDSYLFVVYSNYCHQLLILYTFKEGYSHLLTLLSVATHPYLKLHI